jgi:hypothetical protein
MTNDTGLTNQLPQYEFFRDAAYFDLWAVREVSERRWGHCFHVQTKDEAEGLVEQMNAALLRERQLLEIIQELHESMRSEAGDLYLESDLGERTHAILEPTK